MSSSTSCVTPNAASRSASCSVGPYVWFTNSTWSPACSTPSITALIAAMPEPKHLHASPRSRRASLRSSTSTVGFCPRVYTCVVDSFASPCCSASSVGKENSDVITMGVDVGAPPPSPATVSSTMHVVMSSGSSCIALRGWE